YSPSDGFAKTLEALKPAIVEMTADEVSPEVVKKLHERGIRVANLVGATDGPKEWDAALVSGADLLVTDVPEEVLAHALGQRVAARPVRITCHRGASRYAPENTLLAFDKAARLHADFVEFDVRPSSEGTFYLLHDGKLDRTTNGHGPINQASNQTIAGLDA